MSKDSQAVRRWPFPERCVHRGNHVTLEPLGQDHLHELWEAAADAEASWSFLRYGPPATIEALSALLTDLSSRDDQPFWAVRPHSSGRVEGWLSLCDVYPVDAAIEIGSIWFSPRLQRSRAATETIYLLIRHAMDDLGYRRMVWRCAASNAASLRAAGRYGFRQEGVWRRAAIVKGAPRDVAWHSILDDEWPLHREAIEAWLSEDNFLPDGRPRASLDDIRASRQSIASTEAAPAD